MTISSTVRKVTVNGNDAATVFSFSPLVIFESSDLVVILTDSDGNETTLTEGAGSINYSVSVTDYPGTGSITYPAAGGTPLPTGSKLTMRPVLTLTQLVALANQGGYFPDVQEEVYDRLTVMIQQLQEQIDRSVKTAPSDSTVLNDLPTSSARAGKVQAYDADGQPIVSNLTLAVLEQQPTNAAASASAAAASASGAATSETNAAASASAAATSATQAAASVTNAGLPDLSGAAPDDMLAVEANKSGYRLLTPDDVRALIGALAAAGDTLTGALVGQAGAKFGEGGTSDFALGLLGAALGAGNTLKCNAPTGKGFEWDINGLAALVMAAGKLQFAETPGGSLGNVWRDGIAAVSFGTSGYVKLPNGFILQWGTAVTSSGGVVGVNFPISFPSNVYGIFSIANTSTACVAMTADQVTVSSANIYATNQTGGGVPALFWWAALGK